MLVILKGYLANTEIIWHATHGDETEIHIPKVDCATLKKINHFLI